MVALLLVNEFLSAHREQVVLAVDILTVTHPTLAVTMDVVLSYTPRGRWEKRSAYVRLDRCR
jgi:hypothetical protein